MKPDIMQNPNITPASSASRNSPTLEGCLKGGEVINGNSINLNPILELPFNVNLKEKAKSLKYARNLTEVLFWMQVNKRKFHNLDFDRQRIIGNYIVDFYIKKLGLVIEIDGDSHDEKVDYDKSREEYLVSLGLKVYRILVDDVMRNMDFVLMGLEDYIVKEYGVNGQ
ncbi:endonuclease domain-containing protein [Pedobacter frigiditerrae]|uniref:endonuclease domain-containing protein n=1 Tax=Pedobacter frigiditerrae TaxID=2530452 RepID=UPI00292E8E9A|nr:endonuclease domain-containing protein [Pedobacter frigiditerrae]